ncbi:hypothetical protein [Halobacterium sp. CBA1126]|uniref:hypothetical protein n=1 Tax=Halobacterium sp. CBA1126 TaxID=2668074 RepID=UPI0012FA7234|nr:hypothetical protein [Halobacterium sp. CBA1126]MUV60712.1 hypothetical protein [Halobacterium sp. CBA1126]
MPLQVPPARLQSVVRPVKKVHDQSECHVAITPDAVRVQSVSPDKTIALDYSLPLTAQTVERAPGDFWITVEPINNFLKTRPRESVRITFPFETSDGRVVLHSNELTYRFAPFRDRAKFRLFSDSRRESPAVCTLQHRALARSISVADLVTDQLQIELQSASQRIEFKASDMDSFSYLPPIELVEDGERSTVQLTIETEDLSDIMALIPEECRGTLELTPELLTYRVAHPIPGAELTLHIAHRAQAVY